MAQELSALHNLIQKAGRHNPPFRGRLLSVDPGETTGITIIDSFPYSTTLIRQEQLETWPIEKAVINFTSIIQNMLPTFMVFESYHIYKWRLAEHTFSGVPTIQIIGCLKTLCIQHGISYGEQTAQVGKGFWTDNQLKRFELFKSGNVHARDSLRHAAQFLMFGLKGGLNVGSGYHHR